MDKIEDLIQKEEKRQKETLMMIPSENYTYPEVRRAVGSFLIHKYAEGQAFKRYYQGNEYVDLVETICKENALKAFGLSSKVWSVNVQPHSGCEANLALYNAILNPGDRILSMYLPDGGHLSHGWHTPEKKITLVSKIYDVEFYKVSSDSRVFDYSLVGKQALSFKPKLIVSGGTAYPREIDHKRMSLIAKKVKAYYLADIAHEAGLVAGEVNKSPFLYADFVSMTTHKTLRGPRGAMIFSKKEFEDSVNFSVMPGLQGGPHLNTIAGIAIALEKTLTKEFKLYAKRVVENAQALSSFFVKKGYDVVSGGTDKHLVLIDLRNKETNGWIVAWALEIAGIIVNRNTVPFETGSPFYPSGIRLGTPALSVRKMGRKEMERIGELIDKVILHVKDTKMPQEKDAKQAFLNDYLKNIKKDKLLLSIAKEVKNLCLNFPIV